MLKVEWDFATVISNTGINIYKGAEVSDSPVVAQVPGAHGREIQEKSRRV